MALEGGKGREKSKIKLIKGFYQEQKDDLNHLVNMNI